MPNELKFESKFGFYAVFLLLFTLGALIFCYLILAFAVILPLTNSLGQIGTWLGTITILAVLGFIFFRFLIFLLTKERLILETDFIQIDDGKNSEKSSIKINYCDINYITESYQSVRTDFIFRNRHNKYDIKLETKLGNFYVPSKIIANLNYTTKIREFLLTKEELKGKFIVDNLGWKMYKIGGYLAFLYSEFY